MVYSITLFSRVLIVLTICPEAVSSPAQYHIGSVNVHIYHVVGTVWTVYVLLAAVMGLWHQCQGTLTGRAIQVEC